jgi:hypothetical protein
MWRAFLILMVDSVEKLSIMGIRMKKPGGLSPGSIIPYIQPTW